MRMKGRSAAAAAVGVALVLGVLPAAAVPPVPFVKDYDMGAITGGQREESITVDPGSPDHLAGGANERGVGSTQTWYVSTDGGRNWTNGILPNGTLTVSGTTSVNMSDPSLDFGSNHEIYYSALMHGGTGEPCTLFVSESGDDGANWTDPANGIVAAGATSPSVCQDKEHIVVDRGHSDNVYVAWTPVGGSTATTNNNVVFSRDLGGVGNGFAFSAPVNISTAGGNASCLNQGADFALTGNDIYVAFTSFCSGFADNDAATVWVTHSTDQGANWTTPVQAATLENVDFTAAGYRSRSHPSIDVDPTSGRVFVVYADYAGSGTDADVDLVSAPADLSAWTSPVRVNQDSGTTNQWMPWIDVANNRIHVTFYSDNGGAINAHVSYGAVSATPTFSDLAVSSVSTPTSSGFLGDYNGNFAGSDDVDHPSWADARTGVSGTDAFTARVNFSPPQTLAVTPATQTLEVGSTATVTAHVTGANGEDESFIPVSFSVSGVGSPSPSSASASPTSAAGTKSFAFSNTTSGSNTVHVFADMDENGTEDAGEGANVTVTWSPGPPATLTLLPTSATNVIDTSHTVTATVKDQYGNLVAPVLVRFAVSGANAAFGTPTSGSATTSSGTASFLYTGAMPGTDTITAFADYTNDGVRDPSPTAHEPQATASKTWTLPPSTTGKFTGSGNITLTGGAIANFSFNAFGLPTIKGDLTFTTTGRTVTAITFTAYAQSGSTAKVFGTATLNGGGSFVFRLDLEDKAESGRNADTFRLRMSDGYDTGLKTLANGNIQAH